MCDKNTRIKEWVDFVLKNYDVCNYQIEVEGQTDKGDGYSGDISFVKVTGFTKNGAKKTLDLAIKSSKPSDKMKQQAPIREAFEKEIYIYDVVKKTFEKFLNEKGIDATIDINPYCYGGVLNDDSQAIIFENLRTQGFKLWDRARPVTAKHARLVLEAYGRWHAFSFALKIQKPDVFEDLTKNNVNMFTRVLDTLKFDGAMVQEFKNARKLAIRENEQDILKHLEYSESDIKRAFRDMFFENPESHVILHGDCWNSNFLFKFSDDEKNPSEVRVLDWQCSGLGSPAFDLSHFIYCCVDNGKYQNAKELLETYYHFFSEQLILLGCKPEKVYTFEKLVEEWKKFSHFGLFVSNWVIRVCLMNASEIPDVGERLEMVEDISEAFTFKFSNTVDDYYVKRVRGNFLHYCNSLKM